MSFFITHLGIFKREISNLLLFYMPLKQQIPPLFLIYIIHDQTLKYKKDEIP